MALAGVDTAIWDAVGKVLRMALHRLWGGYRREIPLMAIGGYYGEPLGAIEDEIAFYKDRGLTGMKFKVGGASPEVDAKRVAAAREAAGDDFVITVDANQGYTVAEALEFAWRVEDLGIRWFEEPVRWHNDRRSLRDVRMRTRIPVAAGQSEYSASGCRGLMEAGAIDVCNFGRRHGAVPPPSPPRTTCRWDTTRSRGSPPICWPASHTAPTPSVFIPTGIRSGGI